MTTPPAPESPAVIEPRPTSAIPDVMLVSYDNYSAAQRAVDFLSDKQFPVENTAIVGSDLRLVESVTGRLTLAKASLMGAGTGAWFGLLFGLLLGLFTDHAMGWLGTVLFSLVIFVFWGAIFGLVAHALTGGRRDFASRSTIVAGRYDVRVVAAHADRARQLLAQLTT
jgi:hypothetical protein